jgi:hypothetical protein
MTPHIRTVRPQGGEIGACRVAFAYRGSFKKVSSMGSQVINEVVLKGCADRRVANVSMGDGEPV